MLCMITKYCICLKLKLQKEAGASFTKNDSETLLSDELTEKLVKHFAVVHMACAYPHDSFSYNPD